MSNKRPLVPLSRAHKYVRSRLGYAAQSGKSLYFLMCKALEKDGKIKPDQMSDKHWVSENIRHILQQSPVKKKATTSGEPKETKHFRFTKDSFLASYEWRQLRMMVIKKYGARCMCCGATPQTGAVINVDHIKPRKTHPELALSIENLQVLCHECNHGKGNWDTTDWRPKAVQKHS